MRADMAEFLQKVEDNRITAWALLVEAIANLGDMNEQDAAAVATYYITPKNRRGAGITTFDPIMARYTVKHGAFLDREALQRALHVVRQLAIPIPCPIGGAQ